MTKSIRLFPLPLFLTLALFASACANAPHADVADASARALSPASDSNGGERKIVREASQSVEVKDLAAALKQATSQAEATGGYVENSSQQSESESRLDLRVPSEKLAASLDFFAAQGKELRRHVTAVDQTADFINLEAKIKNITAYRDQLRLLLARAKDMKDILQIQETLTRTQAELDTLEGLMKQLKTNVALSRVHLTLKKERILGPLGFVVSGAVWVIEKLFVIQ